MMWSVSVGNRSLPELLQKLVPPTGTKVQPLEPPPSVLQMIRSPTTVVVLWGSFSRSVQSVPVLVIDPLALLV